jgi:hypothetical protein
MDGYSTVLWIIHELLQVAFIQLGRARVCKEASLLPFLGLLSYARLTYEPNVRFCL